MSKCIELTKHFIKERGSIDSTKTLLKLFSEKNYTVKPHTLAAYLSQTPDFVFEKSRGAWNLQEDSVELDF